MRLKGESDRPEGAPRPTIAQAWKLLSEQHEALIMAIDGDYLNWPKVRKGFLHQLATALKMWRAAAVFPDGHALRTEWEQMKELAFRVGGTARAPTEFVERLLAALEAVPQTQLTETLQLACDVFRDGTDEHVLEWREREGRRFVDVLTALMVRGEAVPPPPMDKILKVMRDKMLPDDVALSEIQDYLTIAGYDVPLRSYATPASPVPLGSEPPKLTLLVERFFRERPVWLAEAFTKSAADFVRDFAEWADKELAVDGLRAPKETP